MCVCLYIYLAKLAMVPFLRDSIAYMIGLVELYLFYGVISSGEMEIWESCCLCAWWGIYVFMVYRTDLLAARCCCCVSQKELDKVLPKEVELEPIDAESKGNGGTSSTDPNYVALGGTEEDNDHLHKASYQSRRSVVQRDDIGHVGVQYDSRGHPVADTEQNPDNIRIAPGAISGDHVDEDLQNVLDELNRKQRQNVNRGWVVVVMPSSQAKKQGYSSGNDAVVRGDMNVALNQGGRPTTWANHAYVRRRTFMETLAHERAIADAEEAKHQYHGVGHDDSEDHQHSKGSAILHKVLAPWAWLFGKTLPSPEGSFASNHIYITIFGIVTWLGILTFFVGMYYLCVCI